LKIFLAGKIDGLTLRESTGWRRYFARALSDRKDIEILDPTRDAHLFTKGDVADLFYNKELAASSLQANHEDIRKSDLIVVKLDKELGIGTLLDLGGARILNIPIWGWGLYGLEVLGKSFALQECIEKVFLTIDDLIDEIRKTPMRSN